MTGFKYGSCRLAIFLLSICVSTISLNSLHATSVHDVETVAMRAFFDHDDELVLKTARKTDHQPSQLLNNLRIFVLTDEHSDFYDIDRAVELLRSESLAGNPIAQRDLADILLRDDPETNKFYDPLEGMNTLQAARDQGYVPAEILYVHHCVANDCISRQKAIEALTGISENPNFWWASWRVVTLEVETLSDISNSYAYEEALSNFQSRALEVAKHGDENSYASLAYLWWLEFKRSVNSEERGTAANEFLKWLYLGRSALEEILVSSDVDVDVLDGMTSEVLEYQIENTPDIAHRFLKEKLDRDQPYIGWCSQNIFDVGSDKYFDCLAKSARDHFEICFGNFYDRYFGPDTGYLESQRYYDCRMMVLDDRATQLLLDQLYIVAKYIGLGLIGLLLARYMLRNFLRTVTSLR